MDDHGSNKPRHELYELTLADDKRVTSVPPLVQADDNRKSGNPIQENGGTYELEKIIIKKD